MEADWALRRRTGNRSFGHEGRPCRSGIGAVRADGGCTWGDVDHATHAFGMATPSGIISTTGVGGLTLGGGMGISAASTALTIDNLLAVDMVLADGRFVTASAQENPDLFWALARRRRQLRSRHFVSVPAASGGHGPGRADALAHRALGGSDAVLSRIHYHRSGGCQRFLRVPDGSTCAAVSGTTSQSQDVRHRVVLYGKSGEQERPSAPCGRSGSRSLNIIGPIPFPAVQSMFDGLYAPGMQWYWQRRLRQGVEQ